MKTFEAAQAFLLLLLALPLSASAQSNVLYLPPTPKPMTVQDVIKLSKAGLSDDVIIQKIRKKNQRFDLSTDQIIQLKAASVSERVIQVMIDPANDSAPSAATKASGPATQPGAGRQAAPPSPSLPSEIGIYAKEKEQWTEVLPEVVNWKTGGVVKSVASVGIVKGDLNGHVNGGASPNRLASPIEFLIVAPEGVAITEYQLLNLHQHGSYREFRSVTGGVFHVSGGATRDLMAFNGTKIAPRTYIVRFSSRAGQYGFLSPGAYTSANTGSSGKIYSFGVIE